MHIGATTCPLLPTKDRLINLGFKVRRETTYKLNVVDWHMGTLKPPQKTWTQELIRHSRQWKHATPSPGSHKRTPPVSYFSLNSVAQAQPNSSRVSSAQGSLTFFLTTSSDSLCICLQKGFFELQNPDLAFWTPLLPFCSLHIYG